MHGYYCTLCSNNSFNLIICIVAQSAILLIWSNSSWIQSKCNTNKNPCNFRLFFLSRKLFQVTIDFAAILQFQRTFDWKIIADFKDFKALHRKQTNKTSLSGEICQSVSQRNGSIWRSFSINFNLFAFHRNCCTFLPANKKSNNEIICWSWKLEIGMTVSGTYNFILNISAIEAFNERYLLSLKMMPWILT